VYITPNCFLLIWTQPDGNGASQPRAPHARVYTRPHTHTLTCRRRRRTASSPSCWPTARTGDSLDSSPSTVEGQYSRPRRQWTWVSTFSRCRARAPMLRLRGVRAAPPLPAREFTCTCASPDRVFERASSCVVMNPRDMSHVWQGPRHMRHILVGCMRP